MELASMESEHLLPVTTVTHTHLLYGWVTLVCTLGHLLALSLVKTYAGKSLGAA